ncbi:MAG: hypothetical protein NC548_28920 [Lachnospiraceae bacterium]|nr:hypothetical protein [Lachnospiraceae bacterium]
MKQNYHEIEKIREFAKSYGLKNAILAWDIRPMNDGNQTPLQCRVSPYEAFYIERNDEERRTFWDALAFHKELAKPTKRQKEQMLYPCAIAQQFVFITHDGHMQGCVKAVEPRYDLLHGNFEEGWRYLGEELAYKKASEEFLCLSCSKFRYCGQCTAAFADENGNPEKPVDFYCQYGELLEQYMKKKRMEKEMF